MDWLVLFAAAGTSLLVPVAVIVVRQSVKGHRQEIIRDLERVFKPIDGSQAKAIVPSFEFVKFKYFLPDESQRYGRGHDTPLWVFLVSSSPLLILLTSFGILAFGALIPLTRSEYTLLWLPHWSLVPEPRAWLVALIVAYMSCLLYVMNSLLQAVENFELGPMTFLDAAVHLLYGVVTAVIVTSIARQVFPDTGASAQLAMLIAAAFAIGYVPGLGVRTLLRATRLSFFKQEDEALVTALKSTPLEVVDGLDSDVRAKLTRHHIVTVQNLATANPIMLFVETPYGIYQIIDWVAQAQLCTAVGPQKFVEFWKLGIRTIFDLERATLENGVSNPALKRAIAAVLLRNAETYMPQLGIAPNTNAGGSEEIAEGLVRTILDDLHIQRLRQIWVRISEHLGGDTTSLPRLPRPQSPEACFGVRPPGKNPIAPSGPRGTSSEPPEGGGQKEAPSDTNTVQAETAPQAA